MLFSLLFAAVASPPDPTAEIQPVPFTQVHLHDGFWDKRIKLNHDVTIWHEIRMCEETKRIDNFKAAAGEPGLKHEGYFFNDSDVYKVIEAAAYILETEDDPDLEATMDDWIDLIGKAQESDGYLHTQTTASKFTDKPIKRWADDTGEHETYNVGHFYEAAVAYSQATGNKQILDIALKNADLICATYNAKGRRHAPGHQEIEIGLVKLYELTGKRKYLDQAKFFLDERGNKADRKAAFSDYNQDHLPVLEQDHAVGHSVRAAYMYCGMIDVGTRIGDKRYVEASKRIWDDVIKSKIYLTGGIGSSGSNEGFAKEYELPNLSGYAETCASIANIMWNQRLFQVTGDGKYIDVLERSLYNAFLSGYGTDGKSFFYPNPLQSIHGADRQPWFACACCPPNVARMMAKVPELMYATDKEGIYVNLFAASDAEMYVKGQQLQVVQTGDVLNCQIPHLALQVAKPTEFTVRVRVPGWARNQPIPGELYVPVNLQTEAPKVYLNDKLVTTAIRNGYIEIKHTWSKDKVSVELPNQPFWIKSNPTLTANQGLVAMQCGPVVYCAEEADRDPKRDGSMPLLSLFVDSSREPYIAISEKVNQLPNASRLDAVVFGMALGQGAVRSDSGKIIASGKMSSITFVPYYAWANRSRGQMTVWIPTDPSNTLPKPADTIAALSNLTASQGSRDTAAINDQLLPKASVDQSVPNQHWWPKKGTSEWVEFAFDGLRDISSLKVYWFDDTNVGECRVPASWRVMVQVDGQWKPVETSDPFGVKPDGFNEVKFKKVTASNLRIEVQMQDGWSTGIHEVVIE